MCTVEMSSKRTHLFLSSPGALLSEVSAVAGVPTVRGTSFFTAMASAKKRALRLRSWHSGVLGCGLSALASCLLQLCPPTSPTAARAAVESLCTKWHVSPAEQLPLLQRTSWRVLVRAIFALRACSFFKWKRHALFRSFPGDLLLFVERLRSRPPDLHLTVNALPLLSCLVGVRAIAATGALSLTGPWVANTCFILRFSISAATIRAECFQTLAANGPFPVLGSRISCVGPGR